ncbi:MAG: hypothetical protein WEK74_03445, partial [Hydrogenophaga sp.]
AEALGAVSKERDGLANELENAQENEMETLRERFGTNAKNSATASRLIKEALGSGVIGLRDRHASPKTRRYLPQWA